MTDDDEDLFSPRKRARERSGSEYDVGYGKPPVRTQFKPGQSGNPKGRPRRGSTETSHAGILDIVNMIIKEPVTVSKNGKKRTVRFMEGYIRTLSSTALKDHRLAKVFLQLASAAEKANPPGPEIDLGQLTDEELLEFKRLQMKIISKPTEK